MLQHIRLIDFKSFADVAVDVAPLTLLVGANAAGKSNFLDALRFLHGTGAGKTLDAVLNGDRSRALGGLRGGSHEAARVGTTAFTIESTWNGNSDEETVRHSITCRTKPVVGLQNEQLATASGEELLHMKTAEDGALYLPYQPMAYMLRRYLGRMRFLEIHPAQMRGYGSLDTERYPSTDNLSGTLYRLCSNKEEKRTLVEWLAELCAPEIVDIVKKLLSGHGRRVHVEILTRPRLRGVDQALDESRLAAIVDEYSIIDLFLIMVDRDADSERRPAQASARESEHPNRLFVCLAIEEIEVWMLALHRDKLKARWRDVRNERDSKERFAQPFLEEHAPKKALGGGRVWAMSDIGRNWRGLLKVCPELQELSDRIGDWLRERP